MAKQSTSTTHTNIWLLPFKQTEITEAFTTQLKSIASPNIALFVSEHNKSLISSSIQLITKQHEGNLLLNSDSKSIFLDLNGLKNVQSLFSIVKSLIQNENKPTNVSIHHKYYRFNDKLIVIDNETTNYIYKKIPLNLLSISRIRKIASSINQIPLKHSEYTSDAYSISIKPCFSSIPFFIYWFFVLPIKELTKKDQLKTSEHSIYRLLFASWIIAMLIIMPIMSLDSSISGDEDRHVEQAGYILNYFKTDGADTTYMNTKYGPLYAYNITFDVALKILTEKFNIESIYEFRHVANTLMGILAIIFTGLFAYLIGGWRLAFIASMLITLTPSFFGHSFNNPKDIPFAATFIMSMFYITRFVKEIPNPRLSSIFGIAIAIGLSLNVRIGGLLLFAYAGLFAALKYLSYYGFKDLFNKKAINSISYAILGVAISAIIAYIMGVIFWPYGLEAPLKNPLAALDIMTNFSISLRQIFEGKFVWSDQVPWYYSIKYISITLPLLAIIGLVLWLILLPSYFKKYKIELLFIVAFALIFPIFYIIYKKSNVYGGWRHLLFVLPFIITAASIGLTALLDLSSKKTYKIIVWVVIGGFLVRPTIHIVANHPVQYVYYNELAGGMKKAYGKYETDYYYHSVKKATLWLIKNKLAEESKTDSNIVIGSNFNPQYYLRDVPVRTRYIRYYNRNEKDWDYAIIVNSFINPAQLKNKTWPPKSTIYTVDVDGYPVCAVIKRPTDKAFLAYQALENNNIQSALSLYNEALQFEPDNEAIYLSLAEINAQMGNKEEAMKNLQACMRIYPNYDQAMLILGNLYLQSNDLDNAMLTFMRVSEVNYKYYIAYYYMGVIQLSKNNNYDAIRYLQQCMEMANYRPAYQAMAEALNRIGRKDEAQRYLNAANTMN